jgi:hypothetical protein
MLFNLFQNDGEGVTTSLKVTEAASDFGRKAKQENTGLPQITERSM